MKRTVPALSVVTPAYNAIQYIERCLDSVREQNRDDVEHLIIDGGSVDGTREFVQARAITDSRVHLYDGPDNGQSHAMNKGVVAARSRIIGVLNVDDTYKPGTLAFAIEQLGPAPEPSFLWGACEVRVHGPSTPSFVNQLTEREDETGKRYWIQYPGRLEAWRLALGWEYEPHPANPSAYFYHRSLHFSAGLYEEDNHYAMDYAFILAAARDIKQVITTRNILGCYNLEVGSKTYEAATGGVHNTFASSSRERTLSEMSVRDRARMEFLRLRWKVGHSSPFLARTWMLAKRLVSAAP